MIIILSSQRKGFDKNLKIVNYTYTKHPCLEDNFHLKTVQQAQLSECFFKVVIYRK